MSSSSQHQAEFECRRFYVLAACSQFLLDSTIWLFYLTQHLGLSVAEAVAIHASVMTVGGLLDLPTGSWADRFGRRRIIILGFCARAASTAILSLSPSMPGIVVAALLAGFGWAQLSGAVEAFMHDNLKSLGHEGLFKRAISNVVIVIYLSRIAAFSLSGFLFMVRPELPYILSSIALALGALAAWSLPEHPFERSGATADLAHIRGGIAFFVGTPRLLVFVLLTVCAGISAEQIWYSFQPLMANAQMAPTTIGLAYGAASACSALGAWLTKRLLAANRDALAIALSNALFGIGGILLSLATHPSAIALSQSLTCLGFGMGWAATSAVLNAHVPTSHRAVCLSLRSTVELAAVGLGGAVSGVVFERFGPKFVSFPMGLAAALLAPMVYVAVRRLKSPPTCVEPKIAPGRSAPLAVITGRGQLLVLTAKPAKNYASALLPHLRNNHDR